MSYFRKAVVIINFTKVSEELKVCCGALSETERIKKSSVCKKKKGPAGEQTAMEHSLNPFFASE